MISGGSKYRKIFTTGVDKVACVATEIEQVILNLLTQRRPGHGGTGGARRRAADYPAGLYSQDAMAVIEVEDNGPGAGATKRSNAYLSRFSPPRRWG